MFWSKNAYRRTKTRSPISVHVPGIAASYDARPPTTDYDPAMDPLVVTPSIGATQVADGTNLRTLHWPAEGDHVAVALVVHGLGEHGGRYDNVADALTRAGIDTHSYDHRGHGGSSGRRNHVERWTQLHDDLAEQVIRVRAAQPGLPLVLYGHSMGGLVCAGYVLSATERPLPDLLVLSAPALDADLPGWKRSMARTLTGVLPKLRI